MTNLIFRLLSVLGSSASLLSLIFVFHPSGQALSALEGVPIVIGIVLTAVAVFLDIRDFVSRRPKSFKTKKQIRDYMYHWIDNGGKVCIFSNDLSWVDGDSEMIDMLRRKAEKNELSICIPEMISIAETLKASGATILTYSPLKVVPQSRFTIVNCGRMDSQVAVGRRMDGVNVIEEFGAGDHPVFAVATDLVEIVTRYSQTRRIS